ncbi:MAG: S41 family peptidase [Myxococcota bacterium]
MAFIPWLALAWSGGAIPGWAAPDPPLDRSAVAGTTAAEPGATAAGAVPAEPYATAVRLVERLFLEPKRADAVRMLTAAARDLETELDWLVVRSDDRGVELLHGDGATIGRVDVRSLDDLPASLARLEALVVASGYETGRVDVQLVTLAGMCDALDRYSRILADERLDRFNVRLSGTLVGIGAVFEWQGDRMVVSELAPRGPAELGGLAVGDEIVRIDGRSTVSMPVSEASRRISGEEGTQVSVTVHRAGRELSMGLTRAEIVVPNVTHAVLPGNVGYVFIDHVSQRTVENLRAALAALDAAGALDTGLVIDLRGNTGGSMKESANVADTFLTEGLLLRTVGKDGGRVQNLQAEMYAVADGTEPQIPIVVVVDDHTASGSEILAGALVEQNRAALVGTRTYGKGTVQKIYNLEPNVRFKLTVARYILANDRSITERGIVPDVVVGRIDLEPRDVRYVGWDEAWQQVGWGRIVPEIHCGGPGCGGIADVDLPVEIARRAVLQTVGTAREDIVGSVEREAEIARLEQSQRLADAYAARGIDWSPAEGDATYVHARVVVHSERSSGDTWKLHATVTNDDDAPLHQVIVQLAAPTVAHVPLDRSGLVWDDVVVPIGRVAPGETASGFVQIELPPGIEPRQDAVDVRLRADRRPPLLVGEQIVDSGSTSPPTLRVHAKLVPVPDERGPHGAPVHRAEIVVQNLSRTTLTGVDAQFAFPETDAIELLDHAARVSTLAGRSEAKVTLALEVEPGAPSVLPLELVLSADRYGALADWPIALPVDGVAVQLQAPTIEARPPRSAPVGAFTLPITVLDDRAVDHVVVTVNGEKVAWAPGGAAKVDLAPTFDLVAGENRIVVSTRDDQRIVADRALTVRGDASAPVDSVDAGL